MLDVPLTLDNSTKAASIFAGHQALRSDPHLFKDDVDIRFSRTLNSCKLPQIRYATPDRLLQRLTDLRFLSIDFLNTFLLTYRVFTGAIAAHSKRANSSLRWGRLPSISFPFRLRLMIDTFSATENRRRDSPERSQASVLRSSDGTLRLRAANGSPRASLQPGRQSTAANKRRELRLRYLSPKSCIK
jgi:RasGEF N-terminal motif